jgi:uncharacterized membrane-anchored protein YitT (DUF2179 family)
MNLKIKKRLFKAVMIGLVSSLGLGIIVTSCKSSDGHCDAYGNKSGSVKH